MHELSIAWSRWRRARRKTQVVQRFWLVGILSAMVGVALALL